MFEVPIAFIKANLIWFRIGLIVAAFSAILYAGYKVHDGIWQRGYDKAVADQKAELDKAKEKVDANVAKVEKTHEKNIKKIRELPDNDFVAGPIVSSVIDGLPNPR